MKIKLSQHTLRKLEGTIITPKVSLITLEEIALLLDVTRDEKGHISRLCPNKGNSKKKKGNKRSHHAHVAEDDEPSTKTIRQESGFSSDEEYVLISALMGTISHGSNDCIIDSGASKHMIGFKESFMKLS